MAVDRAEQLRRARELFEVAQARGLPMQDARRALAEERWKAADARLAARRCGTRADAADSQPAPQPWYKQEPFA